MKTFNQFLNENKDFEKEIIFLIGPPACGKSTWTEKNAKDYKIISRDNLIDKLRVGTGMSYSDTFQNSQFQNKVNSEFKKDVSDSLQNNKKIVVDMTNMSKKSRSNILNKLDDSWHKVGVAFEIPKTEVFKRLEKREKETGKKVGVEIVERFISSYEPPDKTEFNKIIIIRK